MDGQEFVANLDQFGSFGTKITRTKWFHYDPGKCAFVVWDHKISNIRVLSSKEDSYYG